MRWKVQGLLVAAACLVTCAACGTAKEGRTPVPAGAEGWTPLYDAREPYAEYRRSAGNWAVVECTVQADGGLTGCSVVSASRGARGLEETATQIAEQRKLAPREDGSTDTVRFTITFNP